MRPNLAHFRNFLRNSRGAVTVDYVVLAAAVTAVGLFSTDIIAAGMRSLAGTVDEEFTGTSTDTVVGLQYASGFDNGSAGWSGATATEVNGIGNVLGPIGGTSGTPSISRDFRIDPDATQATFSFDLLAMDSLDNESGIIYIDGIEVGRLTSNLGNATFTAAAGLDPSQLIIRQTTIDNDVDLGGSDQWKDHRSSISITVKNPNETVNFGFGSDANQSTGDESFSIDNFIATGLADEA